LEVSIGDIEADYDKDGGGNDEATKECVNDVDFDDSVMMASTAVPSNSANAAIVQQYSWGKAVHRLLVKELNRNNYILPPHQVPFYCPQLSL
jgi:hypothetical protein